MRAVVVAALAVAGLTGLAAVSPASAKPFDKNSLACLVLDHSDVMNTCICQVVNVPDSVKRLLKPDPVKLSHTCASGGSGPAGGATPSPSGSGFGFAKAGGSSSVFSVGIGGLFPSALTVQGQQNSSVAGGNGQAGAADGSIGGAGAHNGNSSSSSGASGGTLGSSSANSSP